MLKQITRRLLAVGVLLSSFHASAEIIVGGKNFTEQQLLTEITSIFNQKRLRR
ncbi:hypothetical protein ACGRRZ_15950 [Vibrio diabolicus]|uniref:hypothetical protein n=1 Tax=Vibrio diabolicus TaxID=50719 RepID=UPI0037486235